MTTKKQYDEWNEKNHPFMIVDLREVAVCDKPKGKDEDIALIKKSQTIISKRTYWFLVVVSLIGAVLILLGAVSANTSSGLKIPLQEFHITIPKLVIEHKVSLNNETLDLIQNKVKQTIEELK